MVQVVFRQRSPTTRRLLSPRNNTIASGTMTSQTKALWISIGVLLAIILSIVSPHHRTSRSNNNAVLPEHWSIQPPFSSNLPSPAAIVSTTHPPVIRTHKGLLIVFIHIPKTGGSSIREGLRSQADLFLWGLGDSNCRRHIDTLYTHVQNWTDGNTVFLEWHTQDCPSYASMRDHFVTIRKQAQQNNIPVFFFSIVREPFAHAVSWYTYYMIEWKRQRLSAQGFRRELISNPQSLFLARSEVAYKQPRLLQDGYTKDEFISVARMFVQDMDWIGTTECLTNETIPLLKAIVNRSFDFPVKNQYKGSKFSKTDVHQYRNWVMEKTEWDNELYQYVQREFRST